MVNFNIYSLIISELKERFGNKNSLSNSLNSTQENIQLIATETLDKVKQEEADPGKFISQVFKDKETRLGKETIERLDGVDLLKASLIKRKNMLQETLKKKKKDLNSKIAQQQNPSLSIKFLKEEIAICNKFLANAESMSKNWLDSNYYRTSLKKCVEAGSESEYRKEIEKMSLGAPVNFRYHACYLGDKDDEETGFFRLGVITDPRNGFTNIQELRKIQRDPNLGSAKIKQLTEKLLELKKKRKKNTPKIFAVEYALRQLNPEHLISTIRERQQILDNQVLLLVQAQVSKKLSKIKTTKQENGKMMPEFHFTHIGFLNRKKSVQDSVGWEHDETNEIIDMDTAFRQFDLGKFSKGTTLIFDGKGPYIDTEGNIHVAEKIEENGKPKQVRLRPHFLNISVQGHMKNDGIQKEINGPALDQLITLAGQTIDNLKDKAQQQKASEGLTELRRIKALLNQGESNYKIAEDLSVALLKLGMPFSMGCLSAKDRTGIVGGRIIIRYVTAYAETLYKDSNIKFAKLKRKLNFYLLSKFGSASLVAWDNTRVKIIKCSPLFLEGYKSFEGVVRRLAYYVKQVGVTNPILNRFYKTIGIY
jgi:hypothetical protein